MAKLILFFFLVFVTVAHGLQFCQESCSRTGQEIRFPFGLTGGRCSYPGFNLSCSAGDQTILALPRAGNFIVQFIDYSAQQIYIRDPGNCIAERFLKNFSLSGSPFIAEIYRSFTFLNCSSNFSASFLPPSSRKVKCLSSENSTVVALLNSYDQGYEPSSFPSCTVMAKRVEVPVSWYRWAEGDASLTWTKPDCRSCEERGGTCGFKGDTGLDIGCFDLPRSKRALPRSAKYGIIIGIGIPGLLCIIGLGCYVAGRVGTYRRSLHSSTALNATFPRQPSMAVTGIDGATLELYPKTLLGESRRLPKPNDNTCPICLCEYQPKETLRTIPECNHYFHADCIDEWLKMNATCPLCRNSPDVSSVATPSSSLSASSIATTPSSSLSDSSSSLYSGP
ncbi:putative RING-H2 finger protein ATL21A [Ricinus communis]|uniref:RING-type E3 ubiquitin transferase n=1 Tax=Ricinus communis TaxID=3988 RepID=B9RCS7_RICCO|nr:putative RING-H2 finger protein ATL21A [Ricinus communis]EEF51348.1 ring finger protein, putative [Ricinus communis]|eukprot:XP_002509961.1 putative RING-H2 finger protein ATL21A [Ricinus communis]